MRLHPVVVIAVGVGATALCTWLALGFGDEGAAAAPKPVSPIVRVATAVRPSSTSSAASAAARDPADFEQWMFTRSSLRGADRDGAWDVDLQGRLHPTIALRRRFDQLLMLVGEASLDDLQAYIEADVQELAGFDAAAQVLDVWQRYIELQRHAFAKQLNVRDGSTWAAALAERQQLRRAILGHEVATAFYADEEQQFSAMLRAGAANGKTSESTGIDRTRLTGESLARLAREDSAWAGWERRFAAARLEIEALQAARELSDGLRHDAIEQVLQRQFDSREAVRVRALLQLAPSSRAH